MATPKYRREPYVWPDGSVSDGKLTQNYAQACAEYESRRRRARPYERICLREDEDMPGTYLVDDLMHDRLVCRATPGNIYPFPGIPGNVELQY